ncbi:DNA polymerase III subunit chi [Pseudomaricurvus sp. HS19]|uniref:DNA polymerase III subunit chi n=1 Tax=Pseudomaricurvus sp. HS19 TaxID=2692626 RepID=UPI0013681A7E|nr:DNA polymerase III subunit chi [Pseudomaricurvus sp. HS19]MYM62987.1 DNA polymerase III subunit chi [Pseudomaricurvus sp. HS19]
MTRVDFYILPQTDTADRLDFTCRLVQKAQALGSSVYVAVNDQTEAQQLDQLLWSFRPESFIPHDCEGSEERQAPVLIGYGEDCGQHHDLLINLKQQIPAYFSRFQRLAEVVCQQPDVLESTRRNYAFYRDRGYPIHSHNLRRD